MLAAARKLRYGAAVAALAAAASAFGATPAIAKPVKSDTVAFKGTITGSNEYSSNVCGIRSDGEKTPFQCAVRGLIAGSGSPAAEVLSQWFSPDGEGILQVIAKQGKSKPPNETYEGTGRCEEREESDLPGTKGVVQYPCTASIKLVINRAKGTIAGKYTILEESTEP